MKHSTSANMDNLYCENKKELLIKECPLFKIILRCLSLFFLLSLETRTRVALKVRGANNPVRIHAETKFANSSERCCDFSAQILRNMQSYKFVKQNYDCFL